MTSATVSSAQPNAPVPSSAAAGDHRGSWWPTLSMVTTRIMELRKRRGLMIALIVVNIGIPTIFLTVRLLAHAFAPKTYGPAGGYDIFSGLVAGVMYIFGFIVAATMGCAAGSSDLTDGMFRHLVVTGRSRMAIYLARIPAGLAIIVPMVAAGFTIVCAVCVFAAPPKLNFDGVNVPAGLNLQGFKTWAGNHPDQVLCRFNFSGPVSVNVRCGPGKNGGGVVIQGSGPGVPPQSTPAQMSAAAEKIAGQNFANYSSIFRYPSNALMIKSGLWLELEAIIGFIVGLGLGSLLGQRTVAVVLMIVFEVILTPILAMHVIPHLINFQRSLVGLATAHLEPGGLRQVFGGGPSGPHNASSLVPESTTLAVVVVVAWLVGWTALGAWRMMTRDA